MVQQYEHLFRTLEDLTNKEEWDSFFTNRGDDHFEWYAEWPQIQNLLEKQLLSSSSLLPKSVDGKSLPMVRSDLAILIPGCGSSRLSENLYDAGFKKITNVDFSKVVIGKMLQRNVRKRTEMKWRSMDMSKIQFTDNSFNAIVDKGGLDAVMVGDCLGELRLPTFVTPAVTRGVLYISKVGRLLKAGGKYICFTLANSCVLDLLFYKFRFGWKMSFHAISKELHTVMVVVEKDICASVSKISSFMDEYPTETHGNQVAELLKALDRENEFRTQYSKDLFSLKDFKELPPGRTIKLILGDPGGPYFYKGVLVDAQQDSGSFSHHFAVYIVPRIRVDEWLFSSEEGQEQVAKNLKASRLLIILLDSRNCYATMDYIKFRLNPLVQELVPTHCYGRVAIPFKTTDEEITSQNCVAQVSSTLTGTIIVDEVIYNKSPCYGDDDHKSESKDFVFRRLTFQRPLGMVQSEALLHNVLKASKTRKKGKQKKSGSSSREASSVERKVDHNYLAHKYHNVIISGLMLILQHLKKSGSARAMSKTAVIGLGGGSLPMFMRNQLPYLDIKVVELDEEVLEVAKRHFDFTENENLKVHICNGIEFVRKNAHSDAEGESFRKLDILIVDVDSPNLCSALSCPSVDFVEESFLQNAKNSLSEKGFLVMYLVCRSSTLRSQIYLTLKKVYGESILSLKLEDDCHEVVFCLKDECVITEKDLSVAHENLQSSLAERVNDKWTNRVIEDSIRIRPLR